MNQKEPARCSGFTLIELSIVLVIIGLIIGGILTGRDLIAAAALRAQVSQIEKLNTAVHAFQVKYNYLPGDVPDPLASSFGFTSRSGAYQGVGNGDGLIVGTSQTAGGCGASCASNYAQAAGETVLFWSDLSKEGLIPGNFNTALVTRNAAADITLTSTPNIGAYLLPAQIGQGNYVYVYADGLYSLSCNQLNNWCYYSPNYFGISAVTNIQANTNHGYPLSSPGLTVQQAYNIDTKMDDGLPQSGMVVAIYMNVGGGIIWTDSSAAFVLGGALSPNTNATSGTSTTCMDNGHVAGAKNYSTEINNGNGVNCALSFQFE